MAREVTPQETSLTAVLEPYVADLGFDLEAVEVSGGGKHRTVLVAIDADGGIGIDDIATVTRELSAVFDTAEVDRILGTASFTLEVSSRGTHRPLTDPRHWRRNVGRLVAIDSLEGERFEARISSADDDAVELTDKAGTTRWPYDEITQAVIQIELNRKDF